MRTPKLCFGYGARQRNCAPERGGWGESLSSPRPARFAEPPLPQPSPASAGESHMDFRWLLHWKTRRILKLAPGSWRESDAEVQEGLSAVGRPACGQCKARSAGSAVHLAGCGYMRSRQLLGDGRVWTVEGRAVAALASPGAWHSEPRHVQPGVPSA